jgi:hypothetical protein
MLRKGMIFRFLSALIATAIMAAVSPAQSAAPRNLIYTVYHSRYGTIGTYTNAVEKTGETTTVVTNAHIQVSLLGVVFYRQDASRQERWAGNRLISFHGVTTVNGKPFEMTGAPQGDRFVMMSPDGDIVAPASVRIANPWSPDVLHGTTILTPDRGRVENVQVKDGEETSISINGRNTSAKRYEIDRLDGQKRYDIWLDERGTPVKFITYNPNGSVTFTLTS